MAITVRELLDMSPEDRHAAIQAMTLPSDPSRMPEPSDEEIDDNLEGLPTQQIGGQTFAFLAGPPRSSRIP